MRVCVVGAGAAGLPSIKACLEEGLDVVCYEKTSDIAGLWNYRPDEKDVTSRTAIKVQPLQIGATVMETTVVNTSKEMMAYSDFPPPADWANFMHHSKVYEYLNMYADAFGLKKYIQFNTHVTKVSQSASGQTSCFFKVEKKHDGWQVHLSNGCTESFDKLMLCTGHHATPQQPKLKSSKKKRRANSNFRPGAVCWRNYACLVISE
jgi:dimethylaniline monooxygenase (N-oxide forming)